MEYQILYNLYYQNKEKYEELYQERINSEATKHLEFEINGSKAFWYFHPEHHAMIADIYRLDKKIYSVASQLPSIALDYYIKSTLITEIKNTNDIEGVVSTRKEIKEILEQLSIKTHDRLFGMVNRYAFLMEQRAFNLDTPSDLRKLYDELVSQEIQESDPKDELDGTIFRKNTVFIHKASGKKLHEGINPESEIISNISNALNLLRDESMDILVRISLFHYLFGYVHPFYNGNGRVSRFISSYLLSRNFTPLIGYKLSQQVKEQRNYYYEAFEKTNDPKNKGDLGTFTYYFLSIIKKAFIKAENELTERSNKLDHYQELIDHLKIQIKDKMLIFILVQNSLFADEGVNMDQLSIHIEQSIAWVRKKITDLENQNLIVKTRQGHNYLYQINLTSLEALV